jgi:hypothetical protein
MFRIHRPLKCSPIFLKGLVLGSLFSAYSLMSYALMALPTLSYLICATPYSFQTESGAHLAFYPMGTWSLFPMDKAAGM